MWVWRRMGRVKWTDKIKNAVVLERVGEGKIMVELLKKHHQCVLPKGRSYAASAGTLAAVLGRKIFHRKLKEPRLRFYKGLNRCGSFLLLSAPHSLFNI